MSASFDVDALPPLKMEDIRRYCCGDYPIHLSERYLEFSKDNKSLRFLVAKNKVPRGKILVRVYGMRSRFRSSVNRKIEILFSKNGVEDTLCTCPGGNRSTGCAHAVAVMRYIAEEQSGESTFSKSLSKALKELIKIPSELISESENESESCEQYDSDYESDEE